MKATSDFGPRTQQASEVQGSRTPQWLYRILCDAYQSVKVRSNFSSLLIALEALFEDVHVDHWGSTSWHEIKDCFVTEPYGVPKEGVRKLKEKGRKLGFAVVYSPLSYHNPGSCQRVLIFPTNLSPFKQYHPEVLAALIEAGCEIEEAAPKIKTMTILQQNEYDLAEFENVMRSLGLSPKSLFDRKPLIIEKEEDNFLFYCPSKQVYKIKTNLNVCRKVAKDMRLQLPKFTVKPIDDSSLIQVKPYLYTSRDDLFVDAIFRKYVVKHRVESAESLFVQAIGTKLSQIFRGEMNIHGEQHLIAELKEPINCKVAKALIKQISPRFALIRDSGHFEIPS